MTPCPRPLVAVHQLSFEGVPINRGRVQKEISADVVEASQYRDVGPWDRVVRHLAVEGLRERFWWLVSWPLALRSVAYWASLRRSGRGLSF
jgi:hypothetical protein